MRSYALGSGLTRVEHVPRFVQHLQGLDQIRIRSDMYQKPQLPSDFMYREVNES